MRLSAAFLVFGALVAIVPPGQAQATSGPGCLRIVNVDPGDKLNIRRRPDASSAVVARADPANQGILHLDGKCRPASLAWKYRWCPVSYFSGGPSDPAKGWVKARFVRDSECP